MLSLSGAADVNISQVYGGGETAGATYKQDYVELRNTTTSPVSLTGWSLQYQAAGSTGNWSSVRSLSGTIRPGGFFLIQTTTSGTSGLDLPTPDLILSPTVGLSNSTGKVALVRTSTALNTSASGPAPNTITGSYEDLVGYGTSANTAEGTNAPGLTPATALFRAGFGLSDTNVNGADFISAPPSPRNSAASPNVAPSFAKGADQTVAQDAPAQSIPGWATAISAGPLSEAGQSVSFTITANSNPALFSAGPEVAPDGTLSFTPAAGISGTASIGLRITDNGGTANGGIDASGDQTFTITVSPPAAVTELVGIGQEGTGAAGSRFLTVRPGPVINSTGRIAWRAYLRLGPGSVTSTTYQGMWAEDSSGADRLVARQGSAAPDASGAASAQLFDLVDNNPSYNGSGFLTFRNMLRTGNGVDLYNRWCLFAGDPATGVRRVARSGEALVPGGPVFYTFQNQTVLNSQNDFVIRSAFRASVNGVLSSNDSALVLFKPDGSRTVLARESAAPAAGQSVVGSWPGASGATAYNAPGAIKPFEDFAGGYASLTSLFHNNSGVTVFNHKLKGVTVEGIWRHDGSVLAKVMCQGEAAPGAGGALYGKPGYPSLTDTGGMQGDDKGRIVFQTLLTGTGVTAGQNDQAIYWMASQGTPALFARTGQPGSTGQGPVGVDAAACFATLGTPITAADGSFGFRATLKSGSGGVTSASDTGIWRTRHDSAGENFELLVLEGQTVPDNTGNPRAGITFADFQAPVLGDGGRAAFVATLSNGRTGLYTVTSTGSLREVLTNEAPITFADVDTGTRTATVGTFNLGTTPSSPVPYQQRPIGGGKLIAQLAFTDATSAAIIIPLP